MPKGQYDRSLTKEQRAALKAKSAAAPGGKVKKTYKTKTAKLVVAAKTVTTAKPVAQDKVQHLNTLLAYVTTLNNTRLSGTKHPLIESEVNEAITLLKGLREEIFGKVEQPAPQLAPVVAPVAVQTQAAFIPPLATQPS